MTDLTDSEREYLRNAGLTDQEIDEEVNKIKSGVELSSPDPPVNDNMLKLMRDILGLDRAEFHKISRVANLKDDELGKLALPTRAYLSIGLYAESEKYDKVAAYFRDKSNIWADTSMGRKGFFVKLPFSRMNIKQDLGTPRRTVKRSLFGGTREIIEGEQD